MTKRIGLALVALFATLTFTSYCSAATIVFGDRPTWQAAASGFQTETFNQYGDLQSGINTPMFLDHFSMTALDPNQRVRLRDSLGQYMQNGSRYAFNSGKLRIDFAVPFTAFALDHKATTGLGVNTLEFFDANGSLIDSYDFTPSQPTSFTGFLLDAGEIAQSVEISPSFGPTDTWSQDNVSFVPVPEPSTWLLLLTGTFCGALRRRR